MTINFINQKNEEITKVDRRIDSYKTLNKDMNSYKNIINIGQEVKLTFH